MKKRNLFIASAMVAALAVPLVSNGQAGPAPKPKFDSEKCYGVSKAGKNDCQTATHSCAGTSTTDADAASWVYVPTGTCEKVVGGSLEPKA